MAPFTSNCSPSSGGFPMSLILSEYLSLLLFFFLATSSRRSWRRKAS